MVDVIDHEGRYFYIISPKEKSFFPNKFLVEIGNVVNVAVHLPVDAIDAVVVPDHVLHIRVHQFLAGKASSKKFSRCFSD